PNASNLPLRIFQGDEDPIVAVQSVRDFQRQMEDAGATARYFEYPGVRHDVWNVAYKNGAIFDWFSRIKRNRYPDRVHFTADSYRYNSAYWVRIDGITPGTPATIDARRMPTGEIAVAAKNVDGFTLTPQRGAATVTIDGATLRMKPGVPLSFTHASGQW